MEGTHFILWKMFSFTHSSEQSVLFVFIKVLWIIVSDWVKVIRLPDSFVALLCLLLLLLLRVSLAHSLNFNIYFSLHRLIKIEIYYYTYWDILAASRNLFFHISREYAEHAPCTYVRIPHSSHRHIIHRHPIDIFMLCAIIYKYMVVNSSTTAVPMCVRLCAQPEALYVHNECVHKIAHR